MRTPVLLLALLIAMPLLGFLPRLFGQRDPLPLDRRATWAQLVLVTCGAAPALDSTNRANAGGLAELERRAARAALRLPADPSEAARRLWTGRTSDSAETSEAAWTVAEAARQSGAATAAFLATPFVTQLGLAGFERVVEDPALDAERLLALLDAHLAAHTGERSALWLHLEDAGELEPLLHGLHGALERRGHRWDALVIVTSLASEPGQPAPFWAELPSALLAGRAGTGAAEASDLAGLLLQLLRLPGPDVTRGEAPLESSGDLALLLQGGQL